jgi:hypothetical protein
MSIDFRKFDSKSEIDAQRVLFKECFPETIDNSVSSIAHYVWKFYSKPGPICSSEFTANLNGEMLGYYAAIPFHYNFKNSTMNAAMVCDVMTGVKARGKGVFTKLGVYSTNELCKQGYDFSTGFPIRKEVIPGHLKAGWEINFDLPLYGRFIKFNSFLRSKKLTFFYPAFNLCNSIAENLFCIFLKRNKNIKFEIVKSIDIDSIYGLEEFYLEWINEQKISLIKNLSFLKWRLGAPYKSYYLIVARYNDKIIGVIITSKVIKEGVPSLGILDISMLNEYNKYAPLFANEVVNMAKKMNIELLLVMMSKYWFKRYGLHKAIFFKSPYKFHFITKNLNLKANLEILKEERNWHLMWIDSDDL